MPFTWPDPADDPDDEPSEPWALDHPADDDERHHFWQRWRADQEDDGDPD